MYISDTLGLPESLNRAARNTAVPLFLCVSSAFPGRYLQFRRSSASQGARLCPVTHGMFLYHLSDYNHNHGQPPASERSNPRKRHHLSRFPIAVSRRDRVLRNHIRIPIHGLQGYGYLQNYQYRRIDQSVLRKIPGTYHLAPRRSRTAGVFQQRPAG